MLRFGVSPSRKAVGSWRTGCLFPDPLPFPRLKNQTFEVVCSCGETLSGPRELHHQEIGCPHCGKTLFVLPADQYATKPHSLPAGPIPQDGESSGTVIDKLNRLALWTRLKESRTSWGHRLGSLVSRMGQWVKARLRPLTLNVAKNKTPWRHPAARGFFPNPCSSRASAR